MKARLPSVAAFVALGLVYACGAAMRAGVPGMVFDELQKGLGWTASQTALVSSVGVFGCMAFLPLAGWAIDRFGWRRIVPAGVFLQAAGGLWIAGASALAGVYGGAFLNGGGRTVVYLAILKLLDTEFGRPRFSLLIGFFYVFGYGGTLGGSALFADAGFPSWRALANGCSLAAAGCGLAAAACLPFLPRTDASAAPPAARAEGRTTLRAFATPACVRALLCTSFGIVAYWTFLAVGAKPYLTAFHGGDLRPLTLMNAIVMVEMIFGGAASYALGNRRTAFQFAGVASILAGFAALACGGAWFGFAAIGAGYGLTAVQICALRDAVPPSCTARAIALANFTANLGIVACSQLVGAICDRAAQ